MRKIKFTCIPKRLVLSAFFLCTACIMQAQDSQFNTLHSPDPFPRTPDVSALEKFGDYPVGYHTGTVNITVPLFQFRLSNSLTFPVSIDYHTSGIKVEELPSSVGLGWALNAGGCISREVRGMQDELNNGYFNFIKRNKGYHFPEMVNIHNTALIDSIKESKIDPEPDIFHINLLGKTYKFFVGSDGEFYTNPFSNLKVMQCPLTSREAMGTWIITDEYGNRFYFGTDGEHGGVEYSEQHLWIIASAWKLFKIESPEGNVLAYFNYTRSDFESPSISRRYLKCQDNTICRYWGNPKNLTSHIGYFSHEKSTSFTGHNLREIQIPGTGILYFIQGTSYRHVTNHLIETISFKDCDGTEKRNYEFLYEGDRCFLSDINKKGYNNGYEIYRKFSYYGGLPSIHSCGQDFWGYYNGVTNNQNMIPYIPDFTHHGIAFANRYPTDQAKAGSLKKITYPTGGNTMFEYENNKIYTDATSFQINRVYDSVSLYNYGGAQSDTIRAVKKEISHYKVIFTYNHMESYKIQISLKNLETDDYMIIKEGKDMTSASGGTLIGQTAEGFPVFSYESSLELNPGLYQWYISDFIIEGHAAQNIRPSVKIEYDYYTNIAHNEYHEETVGGIRIKKLVNSDSDNKVIEEREYRYLTPDGVSSGYGAPRPFFVKHYIEEIDYERNHTDFINYYCGINEFQEDNLLKIPGNVVQYLFVTEEKRYGDKKYRTDFSFNKRSYLNPSLRSASFRYGHNHTPFPYSQNEHLEGLLKSKTIFQHSQGLFKPVIKETYKYHFKEMLNGGMGEPIVGLIDMVDNKGYDINYDERYMMATYRLFSSKVLPSTIITENYFGTDTVTTVSETYYSDKSYTQPTKTVNYVSKSSDVVVDSFLYCHDFPQEIYHTMNERNMVAPVVRHIRTSNGKTTVYETDYSPFPAGSYISVLPSALRIIRDGVPDSTVYLRYDRFGNPLHVCLNGVEDRYVLWSYGGRYPVAEIIGNVSFDDVCSAVESVFGTDIHSLSEIQLPDPDVLRGGFLHAALPSAEVRTFTYDGINGVASLTDSERLTTQYRYDDFGRLTEILMPYLQNGIITPKPTSAYEYHYRIP